MFAYLTLESLCMQIRFEKEREKQEPKRKEEEEEEKEAPLYTIIKV